MDRGQVGRRLQDRVREAGRAHRRLARRGWIFAVEDRPERAGRRCQFAHRRRDLRRGRIVEVDRSRRATGKAAHVLHGQVELGGGGRVVLQPLQGGAPAEGQAGCVARARERVGKGVVVRIDRPDGHQRALGGRGVARIQRGRDLL